jgi:hypothetical protein
MDIIFQHDNYKEWNEFISMQNLNLWPYTREFQYQCGLNKIKDLSFAVIENGSVLAICPLYVTSQGHNNQFSDDGGYLRSPIVSPVISTKKQGKIYDYIFNKIDKLADEHQVSKSMFMVDPQPDRHNYNLLLIYNYINTSILTQIIDLSKSEDELRQALRKSYKSLINKGLKTYNFYVMTKDNANYDIHEQYRRTHIKAAGRETRPKESFDWQFEQLRSGQATLIGVLFEGIFIQFNYFNHYNNYVYYASAADDPSFSDVCDVPIGHAIIQYAVNLFKEQNYDYFELGWQYYGNQLFSHPSEKDKMISYFKRGFGGISYPLYRGIKYYDQSLLKKDLLEAAETYCATLSID